MRKREMVMATMGWEQKWAKIGVKAVIAPHAAADNSNTFSPPTLNKSTKTNKETFMNTTSNPNMSYRI